MGGRCAASLIHKQGSMLALVVRTATHFISFRIDYWICTTVYTPCFKYSHTYTANGDHWKSPSASAIDSLSAEPLEHTVWFWTSLMCVCFHCWTSNVHVDLSEGSFCNEMCFIIKPEAILSLFFPPKWKEHFFCCCLFLRWKKLHWVKPFGDEGDRRSTQVYVHVSVASECILNCV